MVSYCEMLSWMISGFSSWASPDHRSSDYEFLPIPPILIPFPSSAEASFATILVIVVVAEAMQKLLKVITLQILLIKDVNLCGTHIYGKLIQGGLESLVDPIF